MSKRHIVTNKSSGVRVCLASITGALVVLAACARDLPVAPMAPSAASSSDAVASNYSLSVPAGERTVHVRFSRVRSEGSESVSGFVDRIFATSDSIGAERIVLDVGGLRGGDAFLLTPLIRGVAAREQLQKQGAIVVIAGPQSFSPRQNLVRVLQQYAHPVVIDRTTI